MRFAQLSKFFRLYLAAFLWWTVSASPKAHKFVMNQVRSVHYTTCLLNLRSEQQQQIPNYVKDPVVLRDPKGNEYYLAIFSNVVGVFADDEPFSEICHAFLATNKNYDAVRDEAPWIQSSRCYGLDEPGYDDNVEHEVTVLDTGASVGLGIVSQLNNSIVYSQTPTTNFLPFDTSGTIDDIILDSWHTHNADRKENVFLSKQSDDGSPYYGYFMRAYNEDPITMNVKPVGVSLEEDFMHYFHASYNPSDLQSCISIESLAAPLGGGEGDSDSTLYGITVVGYYDEEASPSDFYGSDLNRTAMREALELDGIHPLEKSNFEMKIYELFDGIVNPPASGYEFGFMSPFRTVTTVLDLLYIVLVYVQRKFNGKYPSNRFDDSRTPIILHIVAGFVLLYLGVFLHIQNEISTVTESDDELLYRRIIYYVLAAMGVLHAVTVVLILPKVMGEKRITIPLYFAAGAINLFNALRLFVHPTLKNAFLLWGSVNTFVYVRAYIFLLLLANVDWELLYTYGIVAAASTTYPLTVQNVEIFLSFVLPIVYAPFHEWFCRKFPSLGFTLEDGLGGNHPAEKNILEITRKARSWLIPTKRKDPATVVVSERHQRDQCLESIAEVDDFAEKYSTSSSDSVSDDEADSKC